MATVEENLATITDRIDSLLADSEAFIQQLEAFTVTTLDLDPPGSRTFSIVTGDGLINAINEQPNRPTGLDFVSPGNVADPPEPDIRDVEDVPLPDAPQNSPEIDIPATPTVSFPVSPSAPSIEGVDTPASPDFVLPEVPVLAQVNIPSPQSVSLPSFTATFPDSSDLVFSPTPFNYSEPDFADELLDEIKQQTLDDLRNGGFGIDPRDEDQLVGRQRDREARGGRTNEGQVLRNFAARGFALPTGPLADQLSQTQQETQGRISDGERQIFNTRAELFRRTREFMLTNGVNIEGLLINLFGFKQERALRAAQFVSQFSVEIFDAFVRKFNAEVAAYTAQVQAYETLVRGEIAKLEIFRAEIEAQRLIVQINQAEVDVYTAQVNAVQAVVNIFETEMRAAAIKNDIERLKIQLFGEQVEAYTALIGAERAKLQLYEAQIRGEEAKVNIYQSQVQTYVAEVEAARTKSQIQNINVQTDIERARLDLATYQGQIQQFQSNLQREVERIRALTSVYDSDINSYRTLIDGWKAFYDSADRNTAIFFDLVNSSAQRDQQQTEIELQRLIEQTKINLAATSRGAELYQALAAAAQSASNALVVQEDTT